MAHDDTGNAGTGQGEDRDGTPETRAAGQADADRHDPAGHDTQGNDAGGVDGMDMGSSAGL